MFHVAGLGLDHLDLLADFFDFLAEGPSVLFYILDVNERHQTHGHDHDHQVDEDLALAHLGPPRRFDR